MKRGIMMQRRNTHMNINTSIVTAFLSDKDLTKEDSFWLLKNYKEPDAKRKDIIRELTSQLTTIIEQFPTFNAPLWNVLFPHSDTILDTITIYPVVGDSQSGNHIEKKDGSIYFVIDILYIADFTRIVSQMSYILQNYLTFELAKICIHHDYPITSKKYMDILNSLAFTNGLANYLAWNQSCTRYKFHTEKYEKYKEHAFGMLASAVEVQNKAVQQKVLLHAISKDFWTQFPSISGMFYFDDIYHDLGMQGIRMLYQQGPKNFIQTIFTT